MTELKSACKASRCNDTTVYKDVLWGLYGKHQLYTLQTALNPADEVTYKIPRLFIDTVEDQEVACADVESPMVLITESAVKLLKENLLDASITQIFNSFKDGKHSNSSLSVEELMKSIYLNPSYANRYRSESEQASDNMDGVELSVDRVKSNPDSDTGMDIADPNPSNTASGTEQVVNDTLLKRRA